MKNNEKFGRWSERERLDRRDLIQPPHVYLSSVVGKALATAPSRPLMSPTNCKDVLQAGSGFFFFFLTVIHAVPSRSQSMTGPHVKLPAKICKF